MPMETRGHLRDSMLVKVANATIDQYRANGADDLDIGEILGMALLNHMDALVLMTGWDPKPMFVALRDAVDQRLIGLSIKRGVA